MTFTVDKQPYPTVTKNEYDSMQNAKLTKEQIVRDLMSQADFTYHPDGDGRYNPRQDSIHRRGQYQQRFFVNYSFPTESDSPVASLWACKGEGEDISYHLIHVDLSKVMDLLVTYYKEAGYKVPPPKES
jgi:hypothetical protein